MCPGGQTSETSRHWPEQRLELGNHLASSCPAGDSGPLLCAPAALPLASQVSTRPTSWLSGPAMWPPAPALHECLWYAPAPATPSSSVPPRESPPGPACGERGHPVSCPSRSGLHRSAGSVGSRLQLCGDPLGVNWMDGQQGPCSWPPVTWTCPR